MKILHVDTEKGWRGGEQQLLYLVKGLREKGITSAVACRTGDELFKKCKKEGIKVIPLKGNQTSDIFRLGYIGRQFDIIHAHSAKGHTISALSKKLHRKPVVYTRRVDYRPRKNRFTYLKYKNTDKIVSITEAVRRIVLESFPFLTNRTEVIYSSVDVRDIERKVKCEIVENIKKELNGNPTVGTLAALTEQKDIPNLIEASKKVLEKLTNAKFFVFGEGKLRKKLQKIIDSNGISKSFVLYGFVDDIVNYTKALDVFVLPSKNEGLGSSLLVAMVLKVPVVSTNVGGTSEVVENEETGLLVPPNNPELLADAIVRIVTDRELSNHLVEKAYNLVKKKFSVDRMVNSYVELYREVLSGR
jgi:glycosyltransferase involved in cell wall biosynthesis